MNKDTKKLLNKIEVSAAIAGSLILGASTSWILAPIALGGWGYWRYRRWRKKLEHDVRKSRGLLDE